MPTTSALKLRFDIQERPLHLKKNLTAIKDNIFTKYWQIKRDCPHPFCYRPILFQLHWLFFRKKVKYKTGATVGSPGFAIDRGLDFC